MVHPRSMHYEIVNCTSISQMIDLLQFEPLVFPNYAIFSNYDCGCMSKHVGVFFAFKYYLKRQISRYLVGYLPVKFTKSVTGELEEYKAKYIQRSKVC